MGLAGIAANVVFWHVTGRSWVLGETDAQVAQALVLVAPHLTLAFVASLRECSLTVGARAFCHGASVSGVLASAAFLTLQFHAGYTFWADPSGAQWDALSMGLVMCSSPLVVCIAMLAGGAAWRAVRSQRQVPPPDSAADDHDAGGDQEQRERDPAQP